MMRRQIDVVGAVMLNNGSVLCAQRGPRGALAGYWEFPGGKIEPGESPRAALEREISEELDCVIAVGDELTTTKHAYEFGDVTLTTFWCEILSGTPKPTEHSSVRWLPPSELGALNWAPADVPAVQLIAAFGTPPELRA